MQANTTIGGLSNARAYTRLSGIPFAGILDTPPSLTLTSAQIKSFQQELNNVNKSSLPPLAVDGVLGPNTYARVSEFQQANNLTVTGAFDTATISMLAAASFAARANITPTPVVSSGEVDAERRRLNLINFNAVKAIRPECRLTADGFSYTCPPQTTGVFDSIANALSSLLPSKETVDNVASGIKDVAAAGAKGAGQGLGLSLPFAPLAWIAGGVIGIIILKKTL